MSCVQVSNALCVVVVVVGGWGAGGWRACGVVSGVRLLEWCCDVRMVVVYCYDGG